MKFSMSIILCIYPPLNWKVVAKLDKTILIVERFDDDLGKRRMIEIEDVVKISAGINSF